MSRPLSVVLLSHLASPVAPTGAEHSLALLATGLRRRGHRIRVVVPGPWALETELRAAGVDVETIDVRQCWLAYHEPLPAPVTWAKWLRYALPDRGRGRLRSALAGWKPDVVHVNCLPHLGGAIAARQAGLPVVWHLREILPPGPRRRWWAARVGRFSDRVVAVSDAVAGWLREERLHPPPVVVHNGVALDGGVKEASEARRELGLPDDGSCLFGLLGQILPHKGALEFVRAGRLALGRQEKMRFLLAGEGPVGFVRRLEEEIRSGEHADRFHLLPPQTRGATLTAACDVVCMTTVTPDPFPRTVLEAMARGRAVAAFRSGGVPEMVQDETTGLLVETGDIEGLANRFERLAADGSLRRTLGDAGARRVREEFSLDRHLDRMERELRRVLSP